ENGQWGLGGETVAALRGRRDSCFIGPLSTVCRMNSLKSPGICPLSRGEERLWDERCLRAKSSKSPTYWTTRNTPGHPSRNWGRFGQFSASHSCGRVHRSVCYRYYVIE